MADHALPTPPARPPAVSSGRRLRAGFAGAGALIALGGTDDVVAGRRRRDRRRHPDGGTARCDARGGNRNETNDDHNAEAGEGGRCRVIAGRDRVRIPRG